MSGNGLQTVDDLDEQIQQMGLSEKAVDNSEAATGTFLSFAPFNDLALEESDYIAVVDSQPILVFIDGEPCLASEHGAFTEFTPENEEGIGSVEIDGMGDVDYVSPDNDTYSSLVPAPVQSSISTADELSDSLVKFLLVDESWVENPSTHPSELFGEYTDLIPEIKAYTYPETLY